MKQFALVVLAAVLVRPGLAVATDMSQPTRPKPSSFVPHARSNSHTYGTPIQPAIVSHSRTSHRRQTPKKPSSNLKK
jgi:hypothetical protein